MLGLLLVTFACILQLYETASITALIGKSASPSYAVEGKNFTLEWNYTLDGTIGSLQFAIANDDGADTNIGRSFRPGIVSVQGEFQARFKAQATETRAELTILAVQRSDEGAFKFTGLPTGTGSISELVILVVNFPPSNTKITGSTSVMEGGNVDLNCSSTGKPKPNITWTRLSDNSVVTMPLINISRHDVSDYRCTAENGIGTPASRSVTIDVQYAPERVTLITNLSIKHKVCAGILATFTCAVEASNPAVETFSLFVNGSVVSSKRDSGVWIRTLTTSGDATYKCTANNTVGVRSSNYINFTVQVPPSVTIISNGIVVREGRNVTLVCRGFGLPAPRITWSDAWNVVMEDENIWQLHKISRSMAGQYSCTASNACGNDSRRVDIDVQYPVEATGRGENAFVAGGIVKTLTCPVNGNPEPNIEWYSEETGRKVSSGKQYKAGESGCYSCVAWNSLGAAVNITQCLIVVNESSPTAHSATVSGGQEIRALLTIITNFTQAFDDLNSASSKHFVAKFEEEMGKVYTNMPEYLGTKVTQLRPGSVIVYFILYFKTAVSPEKGIENLRVAISSHGTFGNFQAKDLVLLSEESTKSTTTTETKCTCSDNETTLLVIIGVLGIVIFVLFAVIIWQQRKLRAIGNKRPCDVPEERDAGINDSEIVMKDVNSAHLRPKNSKQQQNPDELDYMPLQGISPTGEGYINPVRPALSVEYAPLDMRTRSWEVERNDVKVEKIIGKGAFGQVAKGTAKNLPLRPGATNVAIKMVKGNAPESDKRDLKSELELMKTLKPHPHVIKLLGCVTESEPLLVLIEYVPYGDLLGYLRKSRGLNDTYYKDPDIKPKTSLTSQQLMKFAWQIADGMSYLSLRKVIHRDLAARNVLVGEREACKITDFGMARDVQKEDIYERKTKGRLPVKWTAYESLLYGQYTTKSDVWSYGVVLYEISTIGGSPYPRMEGRKIANLLQQGYRMPKPEHVDKDLYQVMMNCWQSEPEARPSFSDLTQQLKRLENHHKRLINVHIYDNALYTNLEDLNA